MDLFRRKKRGGAGGDNSEEGSDSLAADDCLYPSSATAASAGSASRSNNSNRNPNPDASASTTAAEESSSHNDGIGGETNDALKQTSVHSIDQRSIGAASTGSSTARGGATSATGIAAAMNKSKLDMLVDSDEEGAEVFDDDDDDDDGIDLGQMSTAGSAVGDRASLSPKSFKDVMSNLGAGLAGPNAIPNVILQQQNSSSGHGVNDDSTGSAGITSLVSVTSDRQYGAGAGNSQHSRTSYKSNSSSKNSADNANAGASATALLGGAGRDDTANDDDVIRIEIERPVTGGPRSSSRHSSDGSGDEGEDDDADENRTAASDEDDGDNKSGGSDSAEDYTDDEDEGSDGYKPGGYHPVKVGEVYNQRYVQYVYAFVSFF